MISPRLLAALALCGGALLQTPALAANPDPAQALFDRGVDDMDAGRFEKACPAIEESYKLDPRAGTLFTLAECEAKRGRFASAAARYGEYLALYPTLPADKKQKQGDREKTARAQRALLAPKVAELTLVLPPGAPSGTQITRDGAAVAAAALGVPVPVDPGAHVVATQAPGGPVTEVRITLAKREKKALTLEVREASAAGAPAAPAPQPVATGPNKTLLIAGGAAAGVGAIAGAVLLGVSASKGSTANSLRAMVPKTTGCPAGGAGATGVCADLESALGSKATLGNAGLWTLVGAGAVGVGTLIYGLVGGSSAPPTAVRVVPVVTADGGGLFVGGVL